jgi:hypothetical protein
VENVHSDLGFDLTTLGTIQIVMEAARLKQTPFEPYLPDDNMIPHVLSGFARFIDIIKEKVVILAISDFHFCNIFEELRVISDNWHASRFANLLERWLMVHSVPPTHEHFAIRE